MRDFSAGISLHLGYPASTRGFVCMTFQTFQGQPPLMYRCLPVSIRRRPIRWAIAFAR